MKIIFHMIDGVPHLYRETNAHFEKTEPERQKTSKCLEQDIISEECKMTKHGDNYYIILDFKE